MKLKIFENQINTDYNMQLAHESLISPLFLKVETAIIKRDLIA